jgi:hypothetical protein
MTKVSPSTTLSMMTREAITAGTVVWQRILPESAVPTVVIGHPNGSGALGFQMSDEEIESFGDFDEVGGLSFETEKEPHAIQGQWLIIHAFDPEDAGLFHSIVDGICEAVVGAGGDRAAALATMSEEMHRWLRFLRAGRKGLSIERQIGLWGELHVLRRIAVERSWPSALSWWTGPSHASHDFSIDSLAIEVKSTLADQKSVRISSLEQLDNDGLSALYLLNLKLKKVPRNQGRSLTDMVQLIRSDISAYEAVMRRDFEAMLIGAGFHDIHAQKYRRRSYEWHTTEIYEVNEEFPRLTRGMIMTGITEARYSVNLSAARDCLRDLTDVAEGPQSILQVCAK